MKLKNLEVLALDCQATSNNPKTGILLEMGWMKTRASEVFDPEKLDERAEVYLVQPPEDFTIPQRIMKMTGIESHELKHTLTRRAVWHRLKRAAKETAEVNNQRLCHTVIHFSRYEERFLWALHKEFSARIEFPFQIICTHDLIRLLLPGLPRKGLRAVTGYFGRTLPVHRRSLTHVGGTAFIWHHLIQNLSDSYGIKTLKDLIDWLGQSPPASRTNNTREYPMNRELRLNLPEDPGIYKLLRSSGDILYVGKAKSLKRRVNSYFQKRGCHSEHILEMLSQAKLISTEPTKTALEAALKESDEIKKLSPPYNIALQQRERQVIFFSKDLMSCEEAPSPDHPLGPFSTTVIMDSWASMMAVLNKNHIKRIKSVAIETILGCPPEYAPDKECFVQGVHMFKNEYRDLSKGRFSLSSLIKLGSFFWKERLDELAAEKKGEKEEQGEEDEVPFELEIEEAAVDLPSWSPEKVVRAFKSIIRTGAHQARRARWFCRLSESALIWDRKGSTGQTKNIILFEQGKILSRRTVDSLVEKPVPVGFGRTYLERQKNLDLAAFDRMRILTTEIKRLLGEERSVEVCLGPDTILKEEQLQRILQWV